jgi:hypothetical protein
MVRYLRRRAAGALIVCASAAVLAACGSSSTPSSPKGTSAAALAMYYDHLAGVLLDSAGNDTLTAQAIGIFNGVIADGFVPSRVMVTVNGVSQLWYGDAATFVDSAQTDSAQVVALWSDTAATTVVLAAYEANPQGFGPNVLTAVNAIVRGGDVVVANVDPTNTNPADAADTGSSVFGVTAGSCNLTSITNVFGPIPTYNPSTFSCQAGSGHFDFSVYFPGGDPTVSNTIDSVSVGISTIIAVRLQGLTEAGSSPPFQRIPHGHALGLLRRRL